MKDRVALFATLVVDFASRVYSRDMEIIGDSVAKRIVLFLEALAENSREGSSGMTVSDLSRALGRDKSIVSRTLKQLVELGIVEKTSDGGHVLGWRLFTIASRAGEQRIVIMAPPILREISRRTRERVHLSVRRQDEVLTLITEGPQREIGTAGWVGRTVPLVNTSSGRALMMDDSDNEIAEVFRISNNMSGPKAPANATEAITRLHKAQEVGYAVVEDEYEKGLAGVGAPIRDSKGRIVAALNISAPSYRIANRIGEITDLIKVGASQLSRAISAPLGEEQETPATDWGHIEGKTKVGSQAS